MRLPLIPYSLALMLLLGGCEIFRLGGAQAPPRPDLDQRSAKGVVLLFKTELDSNNIAAATRVLAREDRQQYLAVEKYELRNEVARLGRRIAHRQITDLRIDTISTIRQQVHTELSYIKEVTFTTMKLDSLWYIVAIDELPAQ